MGKIEFCHSVMFYHFHTYGVKRKLTVLIFIDLDKEDQDLYLEYKLLHQKALKTTWLDKTYILNSQSCIRSIYEGHVLNFQWKTNKS